MTRNEILYQQHLETGRANKANEAENLRSHLAQELNVRTANQETERANRAREAENNRHNMQTESTAWKQLEEQVRSNQANEGLRSGELAEATRTHKANESIGRGNLAEQTRSHMANESIAWNQLYETERSHTANEEIDRSKLEETQRSNKRNEDLIDQRNANTLLSALNSDAVRKEIAQLDRQSREDIAALEREVTKRGQNISVINSGINALSRVLPQLIKGLGENNSAVKTLKSMKRIYGG